MKFHICHLVNFYTGTPCIRSAAIIVESLIFLAWNMLAMQAIALSASAFVAFFQDKNREQKKSKENNEPEQCNELDQAKSMDFL